MFDLTGLDSFDWIVLLGLGAGLSLSVLGFIRGPGRRVSGLRIVPFLGGVGVITLVLSAQPSRTLDSALMLVSRFPALMVLVAAVVLVATVLDFLYRRVAVPLYRSFARSERFSGHGAYDAMMALVVISALLVSVAVVAVADSAEERRASGSGGSSATASSDSAPSTSLPLLGIKLSVVAEDLGQPVAAVPIPDSSLMLVADRVGRLLILDLVNSATDTVLDISDDVNTVGWERGLLGVAIHPEFGENGRLFVSFTEAESLSLVVAEFIATQSAIGVDVSRGSQKVLLEVEQPGGFHQGGTLAFGPFGMLWIALGDGGSPPDSEGVFAQDPYGHGQNPKTLLGSVLRIDVDTGDPYGIPPDNPFADGIDGAPEVWAYGLRNPWGLAVANELLFVPDVGHVSWEELNILRLEESAGANFGWSLWEGPACFEDRPCKDVEITMPQSTFDRSQMCTIIGGRIYVGSAIPEMQGQYLFGDLCSGRVKGLVLDGTTVVEEVLWVHAEDSYPQITAFATDNDGELYLLTFEGTMLRLDPVR